MAAWPLMAHIGAPCCRATYRRFTLPAGIAITPDLRVAGVGGAAVPYAIDIPPGGVSDQSERQVPLSDVGFVPGQYSQAIVDLGTSGEFHTALKLEIPRPIFFSRVTIESSDDRKTWSAIRSDAYVYRVADDKNENTTLTFPRVGARWLRVRILDQREAVPIDGASIVASPGRQNDSFLELGGGGTTVDPTATGQDQRWTFTYPRALEASAIRVEGGARSFERSVDVEDSSDGKEWNDVGSGTVARFANGTPQTTFAFNEDRSRFWRVTVHNGGDAPVPMLVPHLLARPHVLVFEATDPGPYALYLGNNAAPEASYDLTDRLAHERWEARDVTVGDVVPNPDYADPRPIFDRDPWILQALFLIGAGVLIAFALRVVLRRDREAPVPGD